MTAKTNEPLNPNESLDPRGARQQLEGAIGALPQETPAVTALEDRYQIKTYAKWGLALAAGKGAWVEDVTGRRFLDLYGGHCVALVGHCHPTLVTAVQAQCERLMFYSNAVYSDVRAVAVERLCQLAPEPLQSVFLCNSGAEANETALKMARKFTGRRNVVSMNESFHGRTLGCLGATGIAKYRDAAYPIPTEHRYIPHGDMDAAKAAVGNDTAAVILEPIPSMGGIQCAPDGYLPALRAHCDAVGALLIFDEVQTGFGRTGTIFFGEHEHVVPDLITGAKGLAGGFPAGVTFVHERIARTVKNGDQGTTFGGGPLASAAIAATATLIRTLDLPKNAAHVGKLLSRELSALEGVQAVTGRGLLIGIDLNRPAKAIASALFDAGILVGTAGGRLNQLRLLPPLTLTEGEASMLIPALRDALA